MSFFYVLSNVFFFQAEDGIRYLVRSRGLGDVYKRQAHAAELGNEVPDSPMLFMKPHTALLIDNRPLYYPCLLYTSDAADERSSVDLGGRRIIKTKKRESRA